MADYFSVLLDSPDSRESYKALLAEADTETFLDLDFGPIPADEADEGVEEAVRAVFSPAPGKSAAAKKAWATRRARAA